MWKNWLLQWRHPFQTIMEVLAPVLFSALLVLIRSLVDPTNISDTTTFDSFPISRNITPFLIIAYSPETDLTTRILNNLQRSLISSHIIRVKGFNDTEKFEKFLYDDLNKILTLCGIQFNDDLINQTEFPENINISLRFPGESRFKISTLIPLNWRTNLLFPLYQMAGPRHPNTTTGGYPAGYFEEKFITIQHYLSKAILENILMKEVPEVQLQRFPYPPYIDDPLLIALSNFISIVIMLSFVYTCINTVKVITNEKEKQVKEIMKIMGLPNWLHWLAWFVKTFMFVLVSVVLIVILLKVQWLPNVSVFTKSNGAVIFVFLCIYMCTTIMFCFMISAFFSRANTAATIAGLFWFVSYTPYLFLQPKYDLLSLMDKILMCLGSNTAMAFGFQFMLMFEGTGEGLQWDTLWKPVTPDDNFVLGYVMIMLLADAIFYLLVTLYVEAILPGEYGVPQPWYFLFTSQFWCGTPRFSGVEDSNVSQQPNSDVYEKEPHLHPGIQIKYLRKVFRNKKVAVRGLCLNMYEDQITALLGHNGAGKTTTMSMLTGIYPPTTGTAIVAGHDIWSDMSGVRASLGLCPQHNVLFDDLTVKEHLYFFGKLKGLNKNDIKADIKKYISLLELVPKTNARAGTLSGGMKRKLSVGIALCGNSKVVMLDEPTAGMDPAARRAMWDLLQLEKKGRTMLLTTHFMDEADLLGDRIAIMAGGALQCVGSSFFLKKKYGAGYNLTLEKSAQCNVIKITELLRRYIPNIQVDTNVGSELAYRLAEDQLSVFEEMLSDLENHAKSLGILNYGISLTTLEEVFMNVGADHGQEEEQNAIELSGKDPQVMTINGTHNDVEFNRHSSESRLDLGDNLLTGIALYKNQFKAMMMKKSYSSVRSWVLSLIQLILPMVFLILAMIVVRSMKANHDLPPMEITLAKYSNPVTVVEGNTDTAKTYEAYVKNTLGHLISKPRNNQNLPDFILQQSRNNLPAVRMRYIVGASFNEKNITGWFNNEPYHSLPLTLNLIHNSILYTSNSTKHNISITNRPMPFSLETKMKQLADGNSIGFQIAFNIGFSMTFVSSFYILFCVRERVTKAKHLQFVSGVNVFMFWLSSYLFDFIHFAILSIFLVVTLAAFQEDGFSTAIELGRVFSVLIMFGLAMLPLIYLASFCFEIPSSGYTKMTFISIFTGVAGFLVVQILKTPQLELTHVADILDWIFMLIPHYSVSTSIHHLYNIYAMAQICKLIPKNAYTCKINPLCCGDEQEYYGWEDPGIGRNMIFFAGVSILLFTLLIMIEYRIPQRIIYELHGRNVRAPLDNSQEDDDVANEKHKIDNMSPSEINAHSLLLKNFSKYYGKFLAVNKLSVGIKRAECFGLLGINGAGKTSTFKMLTGDEKISYGDAWINGISLKKNMKEVHRIIGYCPQFDALLDNLTGRETLILFCLLRGVTHKESKFLAEKLATEFDFRRHVDKKVRQYSGGNKRKLSTAVALIGDPSVVYLDEPSTGMDPAAKRHLWNGLCKVRDSGKCIVLTSHSMEECEALCTKIAIMVNGNFKCLGSTQHLKSKFSEGYTLTVKVKKMDSTTEIAQSEIDPINSYIRQNFPSAILREKYQELLTYYIADKNIPWSKMFGLMEKGKNFLNIEDYSLGQSSLEQVFLSFTKHQRDV